MNTFLLLSLSTLSMYHFCVHTGDTWSYNMSTLEHELNTLQVPLKWSCPCVRLATASTDNDTGSQLTPNHVCIYNARIWSVAQDYTESNCLL